MDCDGWVQSKKLLGDYYIEFYVNSKAYQRNIEAKNKTVSMDNDELIDKSGNDIKVEKIQIKFALMIQKVMMNQTITIVLKMLM